MPVLLRNSFVLAVEIQKTEVEAAAERFSQRGKVFKVVEAPLPKSSFQIAESIFYFLFFLHG